MELSCWTCGLIILSLSAAVLTLSAFFTHHQQYCCCFSDPSLYDAYVREDLKQDAELNCQLIQTYVTFPFPSRTEGFTPRL